MPQDCHRCGSPLASPDMFCPSCGAPQLLYEAGADGTNTTVASGDVALREIQWKLAIGAAITFAVPVGLLCSSVVPVLSSGCCLWVLGGAIAAVALYQRRSATSTLPRKAGGRIGLILGMLAAAVATASNAGALVFERYTLHNGDAMEKAFESVMEQSSAAVAQLYSAGPAQARESLQFWLSPDGRAAANLLTALMSAVGITIFSMIGGILGTRILARRNASQRSS